MTIRCLVLGCKWSAGMRLLIGGELLLLQHCERCPAYRYRSDQ